jgi:hypothetical protein
MMPTGSNLAPQQYRALLHKRYTENKDNVLGFLGTYKDRLEGELQFLSRSAASAARAFPRLFFPQSHPRCSVPPPSYLDFGRPTTRRKSGSGAGREEEEEEVHVAPRGHTPSTPHAPHSDRRDKDKDSASRHRHRTPRSHDKRALVSTPLEPADVAPTPSLSGNRDRSGSSRSRPSKPKLGHGSAADASADGGAPASNRPAHSSLISLREETDSLPLTREVQDLMARQKVRV